MVKARSRELRHLIRQQIMDVGKGIPLLGLVILPGGCIAAIVLIKIANKLGVDLIPDTFSKKLPNKKR